MIPQFDRITFLFAAAVLVAGFGATAASAADLDDDYRASGYRDSGYRYNDNDHVVNAAATRRQVPDDYDEDNDQTYKRRHNGNGWGHNGGQWGGQWGGYGHHGVQRIEARASYASDYLPFNVKEWRAKRSGIEAWKAKVSNRYGEQYAHWRVADNKQVNCDAGAGSVYCTVSARPVIGGSRWGWNGDGR